MRMTEKAWALADRITLSAACHRHVLMRSDGEVQAPAIIEALPLFGGGDPAMNVVMEGTYAYSQDTEQVVGEFIAVVEAHHRHFSRDNRMRLGA